MSNEAGNEIAIPIPITPEEAQFNEYQTAEVNTEARNEIVVPIAADAAATQTTEAEDDQPPETQVNEYRHTEKENPDHQSMYKAATEGDWAAAETLLKRDKSLGWVKITEQGDRVLHVAVSMKHTELVRKLVKTISPGDLVLLDGNGYTACCYAAISDIVEIADLMIRKNPTLASTRDRENKTPLYKAAFRGNANMVSYFLKYAKVEDLSTEEWFDLLLVTIRREMYGKLRHTGVMREDMRLLARKLCGGTQWNTGVMRRDFRLLANKLWEGIQRLEKASVVELMKNPPILHDAAKLGNVELITMITYPDLVWHTDNKGYTIFHIAVKYRHENLFGRINEIGARKDLIAVSKDENDNNILHLAAELGPLDSRFPPIPSFRMQLETLWFKEVKAIVPPFCWEMRNKDGMTPSELFFNEHKSLLKKTSTWTRSTSDSWMLISTLIFSVVFASAFAVPGGYNQDTGIPILIKSNWFTCFIIFEAFAIFFSACSVLQFSRSMMASDEDFFNHVPHRIRNGLLYLSLYVFGAISAFMSAYFLVYVQEKAALVKSAIIFGYIVLVSLSFLQNILFRRGISRRCLFPKRNRHSLFNRHAGTMGENRRRRRCWIF